MTNTHHRFSFFYQSASAEEAFSRPSRGRYDDFTVTHTKSPVIQAEDYYPFGLVASSYRRENSLEQNYLYNGKELQDELNLGWLDYGARMYDAALGRFFTHDAFSWKYLDFSPYQYGANNPILFIDINGDSLYVTSGSRNLKYENGTYYEANGTAAKTNKNGKVIGKGRHFFNQTLKALDKTRTTVRGQSMVDGIASNSNFDVTIHKSNGENNYEPTSEPDASNGTGTGGDVYWNPNSSEGGLDLTGSTARPAFIGLAHELSHGEDAIGGNVLTGTTVIDTDPNPTKGSFVSFKNAEKYATHVENIIRSQYIKPNGKSISLRAYYGIKNEGVSRRGIIPLVINGNQSVYYPGYKY
jgi:RHS repeat-associated protein